MNDKAHHVLRLLRTSLQGRRRRSLPSSCSSCSSRTAYRRRVNDSIQWSDVSCDVWFSLHATSPPTASCSRYPWPSATPHTTAARCPRTRTARACIERRTQAHPRRSWEKVRHIIRVCTVGKARDETGSNQAETSGAVVASKARVECEGLTFRYRQAEGRRGRRRGLVLDPILSHTARL